MAARKFLTPIDLTKQELQNARVQNLATPPGSPVTGQLYYDTDDNTLYYYNGSTWVAASAGTGGHTIKDNGTPRTQRTGLNFLNTTGIVLAATDDSGGDETEITATIQFGAVTTQTSFGASSGNGSAGTAARSDHTHGTPAHDGAAHAAISLSALDQPTANIDWDFWKITNLGTPTAPGDAATKGYVDGVAQGLSAKNSVRAATTAAATLATDFENGDTVDGVTLATGDRILIKNQSTGAENGIYTVNASGAPTRATDFDAAAEVQAGAFVFVEEGTTNADTGWVLTTDGTITIGSTALAFTQFSGAGQITAGNALTKTGNTLDVAVDTTTIEINADALRIAAAAAGAGLTGGGGSALAVGAGTGIVVNANDVAIDTAVVARMYAANVGDGSATTIDVTHGLTASRDKIVQVYESSSPWAQVECDIQALSTTQIRLVFAVAPTSNQYRVVVFG